MVDLNLVLALDTPIPRYTSYPTAPEWGTIQEADYVKALKASDDTIALYFHIPFCKTMCLFCGCSVVLNRKAENEERYVDYLIKEMDLVAGHLGSKKMVRQLHFGGGTPTKLSCDLLTKLLNAIKERFCFSADAELAIEIDPRTVVEDRGEKLALLAALGFNRVSFGVQDTNPQVQEAVRRRQSYEMTLYTYELARSMGFCGISLDLIYGLPLQTEATFKETIEKIVAMRPDRLSLFSYAKIPWMKAHQKSIRDEDLPSTEEKFRIYLSARSRLLEAGYKAIGMDHFALPSDDMASAYDQKRLQRNFQGYTVLDVADLISFGTTAIGFCQNGYFQNVKELKEYYSMLDAGKLPVFRGKLLNDDDTIRRFVIQRLMCDFRLDKGQFFARFQRDFDSYFYNERLKLAPFKELGLVREDEQAVEATVDGELFIRNITACFDWYLAQKEGHKSFSKAI